MSRKSKKEIAMETVSKMKLVRSQLKELTDGLYAQAIAAGRSGLKNNQLLRECYNMSEDTELNTFDGWKAQGAQVKKGQKAFLFWGSPIEKDGITFCPVRYLFTKDQITFGMANA